MTRIRDDVKNTKKNDGNLLAWLMSGLFGVLSALFLCFGYQLEEYDRIDFSAGNLPTVMLLIFIVITVDTRHVWKNYDSALDGKKLFGLIELPGMAAEKDSGKKSFLTTWAILSALNLPVLLAEFPGFFTYDAQDELNEVLTRTFSTHHPLLHVLLLGGTIALIHKLTGSWNAGIFGYIFIQMLVITAVFAYVLEFMKKQGIGKKRRVFWTLYYGLFPTIVMFVLCSSKDGLFSAFLLLLTVFLIQLVKEPEKFLGDRKKVAAFIAAAVLMPCFRHNGFYAYLVFVPFALIYFRKKLGRVLVLMLTVPVVIYLVISAALSAAFSSEITHHQEMLTVPIMQLARVYTYYRDDMSKDEVDVLTSYIYAENLALYTPRISDLLKFGFDNEHYEEDPSGFWKLWKENLMRHPMTYISAWFMTSYGYWYPAAKINVYKGTAVYTFTYDKSSYFCYEVEPPGERISLIPAIDSLYRYLSIGSFFDDMPVLGLFMAPGLMIMMYLFVLLYRTSKKNFAGIIPFVPILLTWCTVLLGPTYLVRYVVYLWMGFPLLFVKLPARVGN